MREVKRTVALAIIATLISAGASTGAQQRRGSSTGRNVSETESPLTGVYRLDAARSDKLYSVVSEADTNLPYGKQQRFFDDLTIRLSSPDQLAIERRGQTVNIASSRAPRIAIEADGREHPERTSDGHTARTRAVFNGDRLTVSSHGGSSGDRFEVTFDPVDDGRRLRVTRRLYAEQLNQPIIVQSIYNKVSNVAQWNIYDVPQPVPADELASAPTRTFETPPAKTGDDRAAILRAELGEWIAATNARDIAKQMSFYMPTLAAFYLARNVPRRAVRAEKARVFARADVVDVQAGAPEIILRDAGRTAIMRFRKRYVISGGPQSRRGEVVQELRWQQTDRGWKIISERDVKVIR